MTSLREIQRDFLNALLFDELDRVATHVVANGIDPVRRVGVYRNNARETFATTLLATFPVLERLAGTAWLRQVAREYQQRYPLRNGNLHYVGRHFGNFLERRYSGTRFAYFADVARLEWAYQEVLVAADHPLLDIQRLSQVAASDHERLVLALAPASRLVASQWPLLAIWQANRPESAAEAGEQFVDLDAGPCRLLVLRHTDHVALRELPDDEYRFLRACDQGTPLARIVLELEDPTRLSDILVRSVREGTVVDFRVVDATADTRLLHGESR